jgi:hypothetical protein
VRISKILFLAVFIHIFFFYSNFATAQINKTPHFTLEAGNVWVKENFRWSIAGNAQGTSPNVFSELIYNPVWLHGAYAKANIHFLKRFTGSASYTRAAAFIGRGTDTDFGSDNRFNPTYTFSFTGNKGTANKLNTFLSYSFLQKHPIQLKAGLGYEQYWQRFYMLSKSIPDLNTTYDARWNSGYASISGNLNLKKFYSEIFFTYHLLKYKGDGNWNLVEKFQHPLSFRQTANGWGIEGGLSLHYCIYKFLQLNGEANILRWKTDTGTDKAFLTDPSTVLTQFNGALRKSLGFSAGVTASFPNF